MNKNIIYMLLDFVAVVFFVALILWGEWIFAALR